MAITGDFETPTTIYQGQTPVSTSTPVRTAKNNYQAALSNLTGAQRNAAAALIDMFSQYDLQSLAATIIDFVKKGYSSDTVALLLKDTPDYKRRFAANDARVARGLNALSPREYIETERSYRRVLSTSGMPKGFYDQNSDFQKFLENDMSPDELNERVGAWTQEATKDQAGLDAIRKVLGMGVSDYAAYLMDPTRALPLLKKSARAVSFAAAAQRHGYDIAASTAKEYGAFGVEAPEAEKGFAAIEEVQAQTEKLAQIYRAGGYSVEEAASEVFKGNAAAGEKRKRLASQERATFANTSKGAPGKATSKQSY